MKINVHHKLNVKKCPDKVTCPACPDKVACPTTYPNKVTCPDVNSQKDVESIQNSGVEDIVNDIFKELSENNNPSIEPFTNITDCSLCGDNEKCEKIKDNGKEIFICQIIDSGRKKPLKDEEKQKLQTEKILKI